jgi:decaprenyl-phosphate phosphoribosyltransferase
LLARSNGRRNVLVIARRARPACSGEPKALFQTAVAFVCFCLAASGTYYLNDAVDAEPIASTRPSAYAPSPPVRSRYAPQ